MEKTFFKLSYYTWVARQVWRCLPVILHAGTQQKRGRRGDCKLHWINKILKCFLLLDPTKMKMLTERWRNWCYQIGRELENQRRTTWFSTQKAQRETGRHSLSKQFWQLLTFFPSSDKQRRHREVSSQFGYCNTYTVNLELAKAGPCLSLSRESTLIFSDPKSSLVGMRIITLALPVSPNFYEDQRDNKCEFWKL